MRVLIAFLSGICFLVATTTGQAWNKPGHMTSAAIAYADLKESNPDVIVKVVEVLKQHPHFKSDWAPTLEQVSGDDGDLYLFMLAAKWPDDVRTHHTEYHRPAWHFVDIPYRPGEDSVEIPQVTSILTAFPENRAIVSSATADKEGRAVALCWMLHLIGDVQQPLHTITLITGQFPGPEGDKGGNKFYVRGTPDSSTIELHGFWDGLVIESEKFQSVRKKAEALRTRPDLKREKFADELAAKTFNDWAVGTHKVAIDRAYLNGTLKAGTEDDGAVLPSGYKDKAHEVAERRIVLSGYRISDAMADVFGK